jgi:Right handed beta helix region
MRFATAAALAAVSMTASMLPPAGSAGTVPSATCSRVAHSGAGLQRFVARLRPGDTGCLRPGSYTIHRLILGTKATARAPIVLRSLDPDNPATLHGVVWLSRSGAYWTVEDLRIDGRNQWNLPSPIVNGSHSTWRRLDVSNQGSGDGTQPYGGTICFNLGSTDNYGYATDTTIEQSRIHDCGISTNHNHGIYVAATSGTTIIRDNWIYRNGDRGVQLYPAAEHVLVTRNVIDDNGSGVIFSGAGNLTSRNDVVARNIISNSRKRWNVESWYPTGTPVGTGNIVESNCLWASAAAPYYHARGGIAPQYGFKVGSGNVVQRPLFVAAGRGNFKLLARSGCRGFGPLVDPPMWPS